MSKEKINPRIKKAPRFLNREDWEEGYADEEEEEISCRDELIEEEKSFESLR